MHNVQFLILSSLAVLVGPVSPRFGSHCQPVRTADDGLALAIVAGVAWEPSFRTPWLSSALSPLDWPRPASPSRWMFVHRLESGSRWVLAVLLLAVLPHVIVDGSI